MHEVKLHILPGRDVQDAVRILFRQIGKNVDLVRDEPAEWDLDAHHSRRVPDSVRALYGITAWEFELLWARAVVALPIVVALSVYTAAKACFGKDLFADLSLLPTNDFGLKNIDLTGQFIRHEVR
jgi:hypothetical protein